MENLKTKFILASTSPRRKELVGHLKIPFQILSLNIDEVSEKTDPVEFSAEIAHAKGRAVLDDLIKDQSQQNFYVVSADTIVCLDGKIYGKPRDRSEARQFLTELSGKTHSVFTAVTMLLYHQKKEREFSFVEESKVTFSVISPSLLDNYLATDDSLDKAGAYGIQGPSLSFISRVEGCYANVVGFPLSRFVTESEKFLKPICPSETPWFKLFC